MKPYIKYIIHLSIFAFFGCTEAEQPITHNDSSFVISNDISNQYISSFAEDAMGHIWIATIRGANKHNVHEFHQYFSSNDSLSISGSQVRHIFRDSQDRLWFCTTDGVCIYTDKNCFRRVKIDAPTQNSVQIFEDKQGRIFINQLGQLCEYDEQDNIFRIVIPDFDSDEKWNNRCFIDLKGDLWSISGAFIRRFDTETKEMISRTHLGSSTHYAFLHNDLLWIASCFSLSIFDVKSEKFLELP